MTNQNKISLSCADIRLCDDGIMHIHLKIRNAFNLEYSKEIVAARTRLTRSVKRPMLYTTDVPLIFPGPGVVEYLVSEERTKWVLADAFVLNTLQQRLEAKLYTRLKKPTIPTAFFSGEIEARKWLYQFLPSASSKSH